MASAMAPAGACDPASVPLPPSPALAAAAPAAPAPALALAADDASSYRVKEILFPDKLARDKRVRILMQAANGPCPVLTVANVLALRGELVVPVGDARVSADHLTAMLAEHLVARHAALGGASPTSDADLDALLRLLPTLHRGLDLNVRFDGTFAPGDPALALFEAFNIRLVHAWQIDPHEAELWSVLGPQSKAPSFNDAAVLACSGDEDGGGNSAAALLARDFLGGPQATFYGLASLYALPDGALYALFRENHFATLYKRSEGRVFTLVTDVGYAEVPGVVWETVAGLDGDTELCTADFALWEEQRAAEERLTHSRTGTAVTASDEHVPLGMLLAPKTHARVDTGASTSTSLGDMGPQQDAQEMADLDLARALQAEEDAAYHATLRESQPPPNHATAAALERQAAELARIQEQQGQAQATRRPQTAPVYADDVDTIPKRRKSAKDKKDSCAIM